MESSSIHIRETNADTESVMRLVEISAGYWFPRALHVVADLGVAEALDEEPRSAVYLAKEVGADADALDRVLRLLASHGVFHRRGGKYVHNALSRALRSDHPHSMRAYVRLVGLPPIHDDQPQHRRVVEPPDRGSLCLDGSQLYNRDCLRGDQDLESTWDPRA